MVGVLEQLADEALVGPPQWKLQRGATAMAEVVVGGVLHKDDLGGGGFGGGLYNNDIGGECSRRL